MVQKNKRFLLVSVSHNEWPYYYNYYYCYICLKKADFSDPWSQLVNEDPRIRNSETIDILQEKKWKKRKKKKRGREKTTLSVSAWYEHGSKYVR